MTSAPILLFFTTDDMSYIAHFKPLLVGFKAAVIEKTPDTISHLEHYANSIKCTKVITTNAGLLNLLIQSRATKRQSLDDWAGSIYERNGISYLFLNPLRQFYSVPYGKFLAERFVSKFTKPSAWPRTSPFSWEILSTDTVERWYQLFHQCVATAIDIETYSFEHSETKELETVIRCICFTGLWRDGVIHTVVLPIAEAENSLLALQVEWMRKFCAIKVPKIFQNGLYDNFHLLCYNAPASHYLWDTQSLFHSWYVELPKRLDFIAAFSIHNTFYWKDMVQGGTSLYEYNARDGWATMCTWMYLIAEMPEWAIKNYLLKFPKWVPCLASNLHAERIDHAKRDELIQSYIEEYTAIRVRLRRWFGDAFNPHSPVQVKNLITFYGSSDIQTSGDKDLDRFALRHPLNARFVREIQRARELGKLISTNLKPDNFSIAAKPTKRKSYLLQHGRLFYALNPDGTDTTRFACALGANWTGAQLQNVTEKLKGMYIADEGFEDFELDGEQAEARCVAYLSGDKNLIETVESPKDYHAVNVERFFGIPYDEIVDDSGPVRKVINKIIRDLSKRTNHGANYNMQAAMLLVTMGEANVDKAKQLLHLPSQWSRLQVTAYLLQCYDKAYPTVRSDFYQYIVNCIKYTRMLVSPLGWTRYFFGNPGKHKPDLNAAVAHPPQNLSVTIINDGFEEIYWKLQHKYPKDFRLKGQVHDSVRGQVRIGRRDLIAEAAKLMIRPTAVKDCTGITRIMTIPIAIKIGPNWGELKQVRLEDIEERKAA